MDVPTPTPELNIGLKSTAIEFEREEREAKKAARRGKPAEPAKRKVKAPKVKELPVREKMLLLEHFSEMWLGRSQYKWQHEVLKALGPRGSRVALKAANGSGKTEMIAARAVLWHMMRFPGSQTVVTAGVYRQIVAVLWPVMKNASAGLGGPELGWSFTENGIRFKNPGPGQEHLEEALCVGFSASDPHKAEGWHARGESQNLLYVIDEAKAVDNQIFHAMERCQPTRVLVMSSPGGASGAFFDIFNKPDPRYALFTVTAFDCPHITKETIAAQIAMYGENSQLIKSMIYAEFGDMDGQLMVLPNSVLQKTINSPPAKEGSQLLAGVDFAAGGDENVICLREGNDVKQIITWREKDTTAAIGRFITEFTRAGLKASDIYADGGGIGIPFCDALREAGWNVNRVNNGENAFNQLQFANRGTEMWVAYARMVETGRVRIPADDILHRQLTTRLLLHNSKGKLMIEPKEKMKDRGLSSPDRADAVVLAFCGMGQSLETYLQNQGKGVSFEDMDGYESDAVLPGCFAG
jgi:phage terminase large subunit